MSIIPSKSETIKASDRKLKVENTPADIYS